MKDEENKTTNGMIAMRFGYQGDPGLSVLLNLGSLLSCGASHKETSQSACLVLGVCLLEYQEHWCQNTFPQGSERNRFKTKSFGLLFHVVLQDDPMSMNALCALPHKLLLLHVIHLPGS